MLQCFSVLLLLIACVGLGNDKLPVFTLGSCGSNVITNDGFYNAIPYIAKVALESGWLNSAVNGAPQFNVDFFTVNSGCSSVTASEIVLPLLLGKGSKPGRMFSNITEHPPVIGIVGCLCSSASMAVASLAGSMKVI